MFLRPRLDFLSISPDTQFQIVRCRSHFPFANVSDRFPICDEQFEMASVLVFAHTKVTTQNCKEWNCCIAFSRYFAALSFCAYTVTRHALYFLNQETRKCKLLISNSGCLYFKHYRIYFAILNIGSCAWGSEKQTSGFKRLQEKFPCYQKKKNNLVMLFYMSCWLLFAISWKSIVVLSVATSQSVNSVRLKLLQRGLCKDNCW